MTHEIWSLPNVAAAPVGGSRGRFWRDCIANRLKFSIGSIGEFLPGLRPGSLSRAMRYGGRGRAAHYRALVFLAIGARFASDDCAMTHSEGVEL
jgi:hypothetical protein